MKKLIFVRHAKAEEPRSIISDFERSLTIKGKVVSLLMADKLKEKESFSGIIMTSPAFRALETAVIFSKVFGKETSEIVLIDDIYYRLNHQHLKNILMQTGDDTDTIMLFGHNPSFSEITNRLCSGGCESMPKCGIVSISFNIQKWSEIKQNTGIMDYFLKPGKIH